LKYRGVDLGMTLVILTWDLTEWDGKVGTLLMCCRVRNVGGFIQFVDTLTLP